MFLDSVAFLWVERMGYPFMDRLVVLSDYPKGDMVYVARDGNTVIH
jgi:hypothetical protein